MNVRLFGNVACSRIWLAVKHNRKPLQILNALTVMKTKLQKNIEAMLCEKRV